MYEQNVQQFNMTTATTTVTKIMSSYNSNYYNNNNDNINNNNNNIINNLARAAHHLHHHRVDYSNNNNNNNNNNEDIINNTFNLNSSIDNGMLLDHAPNLTNSSMIKVYVLSIMAMLSLLGNILTMWNIFKTRISRRKSRHSWSAIYTLIFHLSIADVMVSGFCIIGEAAWYYTVQWLADDLTCKFVKFFQMFSLYISTYVLVLIGIDRWIAVKYPMKSLNMAKRCYRLLMGIYVLSFFLSLPQIFIFHKARGPFVEEFYQCVTYGFYTADWQEQLYGAFTLIFTFILPLLVLLITYLSTFCTISNSEKMFQTTRPSTYTGARLSMQTNRQRLIHKAKMKSLRISVVIILAFFICWAPYNMMMILFMFTNIDQNLGEDLQSAIFFFGMSNSLVNPIIYGAFHLCPAHKKSRNAKQSKYATNRGDSQRGSLQTAVTQMDSTLRQTRTFRQMSYTRTLSNSSTNQKDNDSLIQLATANASFKDKNKIIQIHKTIDNKYTMEPMRRGSKVNYENDTKDKALITQSLLTNGNTVAVSNANEPLYINTTTV